MSQPAYFNRMGKDSRAYAVYSYLFRTLIDVFGSTGVYLALDSLDDLLQIEGRPRWIGRTERVSVVPSNICKIIKRIHSNSKIGTIFYGVLLKL